MINNKFKARIAQGEKLVGGWLMSNHIQIAEIFGQVGYDFVVIDCEHSLTDAVSAYPIMLALQATGTEIIVRVADQQMMSIRKALDFGATTIVVPFVENADEMQKIIDHSYYPPMGRRGYAGTIRASGYGANKQYVRQISQELMIIPQLETPNAVKNMESIAKIKGVGGIFFGPGDYSANIGQIGQAFGADTTKIMHECAKIAQKMNLSLGTVSATPEIARNQVANGISWTALKNDLALVAAGAKASIAEFKQEKNQESANY